MLSDIPVLGQVFFSHNVSVYGSFVAVAVAAVFPVGPDAGSISRGG